MLLTLIDRLPEYIRGRLPGFFFVDISITQTRPPLIRRGVSCILKQDYIHNFLHTSNKICSFKWPSRVKPPHRRLTFTSNAHYSLICLKNKINVKEDYFNWHWRFAIQREWEVPEMVKPKFQKGFHFWFIFRVFITIS